MARDPQFFTEEEQQASEPHEPESWLIERVQELETQLAKAEQKIAKMMEVLGYVEFISEDMSEEWEIEVLRSRINQALRAGEGK